MVLEVITKVREFMHNLPTPYTEVIITGNFNLPNISWPSMKINGGSREEKIQAKELTSIIENYYLTQLIEDSTRGNNILDLLLRNNFELVHSYATIQTPISDHCLIKVTTNIPKTSVNTELDYNHLSVTSIFIVMK